MLAMHHPEESAVAASRMIREATAAIHARIASQQLGECFDRTADRERKPCRVAHPAMKIAKLAMVIYVVQAALGFAVGLTLPILYAVGVL